MKSIPLWYVFWGLAVIVATVVNIARLRAEGVSAARTVPALLFLAAVALAGARMEFVLENDLPPGAWLADGGFRLPGGLIALALALPLAGRWLGLSLGALLDAITPGIVVAIVIGRLGCFVVGCCYGRPTDLPWAVSYGLGHPPFANHFRRGLLTAGATTSLPVHPLGLYFMLVAAAIAGVVAWLGRHRPWAGAVALWFVVLHGWTKVPLEQLRERAGTSLVNHSALVELGPALAATVLLVAITLARRRRYRLSPAHSGVKPV